MQTLEVRRAQGAKPSFITAPIIPMYNCIKEHLHNLKDEKIKKKLDTAGGISYNLYDVILVALMM